MTFWSEETIAKGLISKAEVNEMFVTAKSPFQKIQVCDLGPFGRSLMLDGLLQSCEADEAIYHETLVHPSLLAHPNPKSVYIGGGGEGATAREVLRFSSVERCVMVDIDEIVVEESKKWLKQHHAGCFEDPRLQLVIDDAEKWLKESDERFDVIILDLADPIEEGPCWKLYTIEFYQFLISRLNEGGILVTQCGPSGSLFCKNVFSPVHNTLKKVFKNVLPYSTHIYTFQDTYGFTMASNSPIEKLSADEIDKRLAERVKGTNKHYDGETHIHMTTFPKHIREAFANETRIGTLDNPQSFYI